MATAHPVGMPTAIKSSFPAVAGGGARVLILGSLPGEQSLLMGQYYANPRNQFWRLMESVIGAELVSLTYPARLDSLLSAGVGLWDTIGSATRVGSLDADIRGHRPNPLRALTDTLPFLRAVAYNGAKASAVGRVLLGDDSRLTQITLPSSSAALARPFERKQAEWIQLQTFLDLATDHSRP